MNRGRVWCSPEHQTRPLFTCCVFIDETTSLVQLTVFQTIRAASGAAGESLASTGTLASAGLFVGPALPYQASLAFSALLAVALFAFMATHLK